MDDLTPVSISSRGVIKATDADGITHHFHTDPEESRQFAAAVRCFTCGREELGLLLYSGDNPEQAARRHQDGRTDEQLKDDWLTKVCSAGMPREAALAFLTARLSIE